MAAWHLENIAYIKIVGIFEMIFLGQARKGRTIMCGNRAEIIALLDSVYTVLMVAVMTVMTVMLIFAVISLFFYYICIGTRDMVAIYIIMAFAIMMAGHLRSWCIGTFIVVTVTITRSVDHPTSGESRHSNYRSQQYSN